MTAEWRDGRYVLDLDATARVEVGGTIVDLRGDIDVFTAAKLRSIVEQFVRSGETAVALDVSGVQYIDPRGAEALLSCAGLAAEAGCRLTVQGPSRGVRRLMDLFDLSSMLNESPTQ